ncbi:uncharacterized protein RAG0_15377 [Rhynchosporium agropyri]|uniref:P-type ATPase A domain-containing protein n=1 Tax=Rhynchosporium agropyri TaxID=914238 RepID=A0A1E1LKY5_9HELO|nr:uncharacterized protein RAG0_15377 [Rhynchosporium agropyri]
MILVLILAMGLSYGVGDYIEGGVLTAVIVLNISEVVPGDIIILKMGEIIPADLRMFETMNFNCDEKSLTGEAEPVEKRIEADIFIPETDTVATSEEDVPVGDRLNVVYTEGQRTRNCLRDWNADRGRLAYILFGCAILLAIVVFAVNKFNVTDEVAIYAIPTGIAIMPESLIAILTITIVVRMTVMRKANVVIRDLSALEALGGIY